ncbi:hypothetical protein ACIRST_41880 [Kitasatospora sp. NPDC101447]|uniref:hypothetical protein n=1 Tax=Kitasatospora sp. NPDC101447 TaxID=3364102 RepID=UPI00381569C8
MSTHAMVPPLLVAAVVLLAVRLARQRRNGTSVPLLPRSLPARTVSLVVIALVMLSGALVGHPWEAIIPAVTLGGLTGALVDLRYGSPR